MVYIMCHGKKVISFVLCAYLCVCVTYCADIVIPVTDVPRSYIIICAMCGAM